MSRLPSTSWAGLNLNPVRTCVGCRSRAEQNQLLRVVLLANEVVPDSDSRLHGRGAYLHLNHECIDRAIQRRSLSRALGTTEVLNYQALQQFASRFISPQA